MDIETIKHYAISGEMIRKPVSEFAWLLRDSGDGSFSTQTDWLQMFQYKMSHMQIAKIIRTVEKEGFLYPIGMYLVDDYADTGRDYLQIGNGHHRLMISIFAEVLKMNRIPGVMSIKAIKEFTNPCVVFNNTWPREGQTNEDDFRYGIPIEDYSYGFNGSAVSNFFVKEVEPRLPLVEKYIDEIAFADSNVKELQSV